MKRYEVKRRLTEKEREKFGTHPELVAHLLFHRGIESADDAKLFLNPDYGGLHDPFLLKGMERSVKRILKAIKNDERIAVFTDYDCDGIPASVIFHDFFKKIGFKNFENYIPDRQTEGFGLNKEAIGEIVKRGASLIISADCGIADIEEGDVAHALGVDLIITDHHEPPEKLPKAYAIIDPKQAGCEYPDKNLCGSGVAFKLITALIMRGKFELVPGWEKWLLDMVGLATLSDMVPLVGENRVLAHYGLKVLRKTPRIGLLRLCRAAKVDMRHLSEDDIGFTLSPRINAASRMGSPLDAFKLLSTEDENEAEELAKHLVRLNDERKGVVASMVKEMRHVMSERHPEGSPSVVALGNPKWKPSLLGLVANKLADEHNCPVFLWGREGAVLKGSCRSDGVTDLIELMREASVFEQFGGHRFSGGFTLTLDSVDTFESALVKAQAKLSREKTEKIEYVDRRLSLSEVGWATYRLIENLSPFGVGNAKPVFLIEDARVARIKQFGKERNHTELLLEDEDGFTVPAIAFFTKPEDFGSRLSEGSLASVVGSLEKSVFRGFPELRLRIVDII